jgi:hypothetical protein
MSFTKQESRDPNQTDDVSLKLVKESEQTSTPLLDKATPVNVSKDWPTSPKRIRTTLYVGTWNLLVDVVLLAFSTVFLVFALIVNDYNGAPTRDHPRALERLQKAAKYVRIQNTLNIH